MKLLLLTTGGTIASIQTEEGLAPNLNYAEFNQMIKTFFPEYSITIKELFSLDSSNIQPEEWELIAKEIAVQYQNYAGIVLTHGTDTMAYTASALSYMLQNIPIPVVLTGSQLPLVDPLTDAIENLRYALRMASTGKPGIFIAFNRKIILGTRAVKIKTSTFDAFESMNYPLVATVTTSGFDINEAALPPLKGPFRFIPDLSDQVFLIKLIPGFQVEFFKALPLIKCRGLVIEAFGAGGLQFVRRNLVAELKEIVQQGISVVVSSQCIYKSSDFSIYQVGRKTLAAGVIEARDMTTESAVTKLMWALAQTNDIAEIRKIFQTNYCGEILL